MGWTSAEWAAVAAIAAAVAAATSLWQAWEFRKQAKLDRENNLKARAFDFAPANSPEFIVDEKKLAELFVKYWSKRKTVPLGVVKSGTNLPHKVSSFNHVLNHYGRIASAYKYGVIDKDVTRNLYQYRFVRFWTVFQEYLNDQFKDNPDLKEQYSDSRELFEKWRVK